MEDLIIPLGRGAWMKCMKGLERKASCFWKIFGVENLERFIILCIRIKKEERRKKRTRKNRKNDKINFFFFL